MSEPPDWRGAVTAQAARDGIVLPGAILDELAIHLEDLYTAALAEGLSDDDARARAREALAQSALPALHRRAARDRRREYRPHADDVARMSRGRSVQMLSALRMALRQFRQQPTFACVTVLVLGLGTGAATTVFTVVDGVVLRPLPYAQPDRLVTLWATNHEKGLSHDPISPVDFMDYRALPVFKDAAGWWRPAVNLAEPGQEPVRVNTIEASANLFDVLGVRPQIGEGFPSNDALYVRNEPAAVISDRLWRTRFGADPAVLGRQIMLSDTPYTVVGVMPPKFQYPDDVDVWQRLGWDFRQHSRAARFIETVARLGREGLVDHDYRHAVGRIGRGERAAPQHLRAERLEVALRHGVVLRLRGVLGPCRRRLSDDLERYPPADRERQEVAAARRGDAASSADRAGSRAASRRRPATSVPWGGISCTAGLRRHRPSPSRSSASCATCGTRRSGSRSSPPSISRIGSFPSASSS